MGQAGVAFVDAQQLERGLRVVLGSVLSLQFGGAVAALLFARAGGPACTAGSRCGSRSPR
ncbi:hypothetical protein ACQP2E_22005 [Actinoplanes sp. CA-015351]|uniref:hypothetical protein n=1 Tax=Actinoplanes sp. CA-015351 TaxID=3239897 RepID=UPI003D99A626